MAATTPPIPASLPTPPSVASPSDFDTKADAFNAALALFQTDTNAVAANAYANAVESKTQADIAVEQAAAAASSASTAAAAAGASLWVSGTNYTKGTPVISTVNVLLYRRLIAGGGTTDPSLDTTSWALAVPMTPASIATSSVFLSTNFGAL